MYAYIKKPETVYIFNYLYIYIIFYTYKVYMSEFIT